MRQGAPSAVQTCSRSSRSFAAGDPGSSLAGADGLGAFST